MLNSIIRIYTMDSENKAMKRKLTLIAIAIEVHGMVSKSLKMILGQLKFEKESIPSRPEKCYDQQSY